MSKMKPIFLFVLLAFLLTWLFWWITWFQIEWLGDISGRWWKYLAMWMPAFSYWIVKQSFPEDAALGASFSLNIKKKWKYYLAALWGPAVLSVLGMGLYFLLFQDQFSLDFETLQDVIGQTGKKATADSIRAVIFAQLFASVTFAPLLNSLFALGEEIGWRGYLYTSLRSHFSPLQTHCLVALIWSLWHLPINLQGYNFGVNYWGYPWLGVVAMFIFCFSLQILLSWVMEKTGSLWAPAVLHGAVNAIAAVGLLFRVSSGKAMTLQILGPTPAGLIAGLPLLGVALFIFYREWVRK